MISSFEEDVEGALGVDPQFLVQNLLAEAEVALGAAHEEGE